MYEYLITLLELGPEGLVDEFENCSEEALDILYQLRAGEFPKNFEEFLENCYSNPQTSRLEKLIVCDIFHLILSQYNPDKYNAFSILLLELYEQNLFVELYKLILENNLMVMLFTINSSQLHVDYAYLLEENYSFEDMEMIIDIVLTLIEDILDY